MKNKPRKGAKISRRGMLPLLGGSLLIPFLGFSNTTNKEPSISENEEYQTLLKPDGTTVKVRVETVIKSKVIKKKVSNKSLLKWLNKKL